MHAEFDELLDALFQAHVILVRHPEYEDLTSRIATVIESMEAKLEREREEKL